MTTDDLTATDTDQARMTLGDHLEELRRRLLRAVLAVVVGLVVCLVFGDRIMQIMCWPAAAVMRYRDMPVRLRVLAPAESFVTYIKVCLIWGLIVSAPYALWQLWRFVASGLYPHERRLVRRYVPMSLGLFVLGVTFFLSVIAPIGLNFFLGFAQNNFPAPAWPSPVLIAGGADARPGADTQPNPTAPPTGAPARLPVLSADPPAPREGDVWVNAKDGRMRLFAAGRVRALEPATESFLSPELTLDHYMTFVSWLALVFGLGFQVPIVVLVLGATRLVPVERLRRSRKYVLLVLFAIAAVLTPPDVISQAALGVPMYLLFELGLLLARRAATAPTGEPGGENRRNAGVPR